MSILHGGLLGAILGETPSTKYDIGKYQQEALTEMLQLFSFENMANQRLGHGFEPIDWPTIIINQFRAEALTRPMTVCEKLLYDGAIQAKQEKTKYEYIQ